MSIVLSPGDEAGTAPIQTHLGVCPGCAGRVDQLATLLSSLPAVASAGFEEVFTPSRLQIQRARIGHRLAQIDGGVAPARLLRFPRLGPPPRWIDRRPGRWRAVGATAGLLFGVTAGQLVHFHPVPSHSATLNRTLDVGQPPLDARPAGILAMTGTVELPPGAGDSPTEPARLTVSGFERVMAEEEFLGHLDLALTSLQVTELESIDALTPRVRDLAINIR